MKVIFTDKNFNKHFSIQAASGLLKNYSEKEYLKEMNRVLKFNRLAKKGNLEGENKDLRVIIEDRWEIRLFTYNKFLDYIGELRQELKYFPRKHF